MGLKVCQLCAVDFTLEHFLLPLIDGMRDVGWEVTAICSNGPAISRLRERGYVIEPINIERSFSLPRHISSTLALVRLFKAHKFDVVHVHTPVAALIGRIAARIAGVPMVVYTAHGFYFHNGMPGWKRSVFVALEWVAGRLTDLLFCQSNEDSLDAVKSGICPADRVLTIGNGVSTTDFDPDRVGDGRAIRAKLGIPPEAFVVGLIARQVREKGIGEFLQGVVELSSKHSNLWAIIVGERLRSDHTQGVSQDLNDALVKMSGRLVLTGPRSDIPELLSAINLFCLPSWREGMPRTIIEAMMMAKPVVATNIRGSREEVVDGETGLLVPVRSPDQLAAAIEAFILSPDLAKRAGQAGRVRALNLYDEAKVVDLQINRIKVEAQRKRLLLQ